MDSTYIGSEYQGGRSKRKKVVPIRYTTDLGFADDKTEKTADAEESDEVNYDGDQNPSNYGDSISDLAE